jgi:lysophospholipase L1-like esterase
VREIARWARWLIFVVVIVAGLAAHFLSPAPHHLRVLFVGDFLTAGAGASDRAHAFPALVAGDLDAQVFRLSAARAPDALRLSEQTGRPPAVDFIVVELGSRDWSGDRAGQPPAPTLPADFRTAYIALVQRLLAASPGAGLICLSAWTPPATRNAAGYPATVYDDDIAEACGFTGHRTSSGHYTWYADVTGVFRPSWRVGGAPAPGSEDALRPSDAGHRAIAANVLYGVEYIETGALDP